MNRINYVLNEGKAEPGVAFFLVYVFQLMNRINYVLNDEGNQSPVLQRERVPPGR
jgi:hypothetical protein